MNGVRSGVWLAAACCSVLGGCGAQGPGIPVDAGAEDTSVSRGLGDGSDGMDGGSSLDAPRDTSSDTPPSVVEAGPDATMDAGADGSSGMTDGAPDGAGTLSSFAGYGWVALPAPRGTPITAIAVDSEGVLYVGAGGTDPPPTDPSAGIFQSKDQGASWHEANYGVFDYHIASLFADGTTMYAGTQNLLRSVDRGLTWQQQTPRLDDGLISAIGGQGNLVFATPNFGMNPSYVSNNGGSTFTATNALETLSGPTVAVLGSVILYANEAGVFRSTDGGMSFSNVQGMPDVLSVGGSVQLACDGVQTCYASALAIPDASIVAVLFKSTDAGATWTPLGPTDVQVLAVSDTGILYALSQSVIIRSDDGGATFVSVNLPTPTGAFQPNCSGPFVARGDRLIAACTDGVYRSDDKGAHWQAANGSPATGTITGAVLNLAVDTSATALGAAGDIYVVVNGPISNELRRSTDGGWTWQVMLRSARKCVLSSSGAILCTVDSGIAMMTLVERSADHGVTWQTATLPAGPVAVTPFDVADIAAGSSGAYAGGRDGVARSDDDGLTFQLQPSTPGVTALQVLRSGHVLATASATNMLNRSIDRGATFQPLSMGASLPLLEDPAGRLLYATYSIAASTDEGDTWQTIPSNGLFLDQNVLSPLGEDGADHLFLVLRAPAPSDFAGLPAQLYGTADGSNWSAFPVATEIPNPNVRAFATDKQGRLLAATTGGLFRFESAADPGPSPPEVDAGTSSAPPARALSLFVQNAPWPAMIPSNSGLDLTVDTAGNTYVSDGNTNIYLVDSTGAVSTYMTTAEAASSAGLKFASQFVDLDFGPDGLLYIDVSGGLIGSTTSTDVVVQSSAAHQATLWRDLGTLESTQLLTTGPGQVAFGDSLAGFSVATASTVQPVYTFPALHLSTGCGLPEFALSSGGAVAFLPGCTLNAAVQRGTLGGATATVLYQPNTDPTVVENFACTVGDPAGGFYFVVTDASGDSPRLYHAADSATGPTSLTLVTTQPTLGEMHVAHGGKEFSACRMAVEPNGVLELLTAKDIWQVGP